jgi:probable addiction module antidote protein
LERVQEDVMSKRKPGPKAKPQRTHRPSRSWDDFMRDELANPARARAYLEVAIEEFQASGSGEDFLEALRHLAQAGNGMADIARKTGVSRESLYRTLSRHGNPQFKTVLGVIGALGMRVQIAPLERRPS